MKNRILPAAQFDALKAAAEKNGGVGTGHMFDDHGCGFCGYGLALQAGILIPPPERVEADDKASWLYEQSDACALPFRYDDSDAAVTGVRKHYTGYQYEPRVPFDLWAKELGLVRGDA